MLVEVAINSAPAAIDRTLTYVVPPELQAGIQEGSLVLVTGGEETGHGSGSGPKPIKPAGRG